MNYMPVTAQVFFCVLSPFIELFLKGCISLSESQGHREGETERNLPYVGSLPRQAKLKLRARGFIQVSHMDERALSIWTIFHCLSRCTSKEVKPRGAAGTPTGTQKGCQRHTWWLCHNTSPFKFLRQPGKHASLFQFTDEKNWCSESQRRPSKRHGEKEPPPSVFCSSGLSCPQSPGGAFPPS